MQRSVAKKVVFVGVGLHTGRAVRVTVAPAPADHGIVFERTDLDGLRIPARWDQVEVSPLNTRLMHPSGAYVSTIEHLMAACAGLGLNNLICRIDGPELPILDGSAEPFARALMAAGFVEQDAPLSVIEILHEVEFQRGDSWARLSPGSEPSMSFDIAFDTPAIGQQHHEMSLINGAFLRELSHCRTFCCHADVEKMRADGFALGGSLSNAVVVDGDEILTPGGLRHAQEPVRHKMLDAVGDLYTAGAPILGHYHGHRAGHAVTNGLLRALFATPSAWRLRRADAAMRARLMGSGLSAADFPAVA